MSISPFPSIISRCNTFHQDVLVTATLHLTKTLDASKAKIHSWNDPLVAEKEMTLGAPFFIQDDLVGWIPPMTIPHLKSYPDVFSLIQLNIPGCVSYGIQLSNNLATPDMRTQFIETFLIKEFPRLESSWRHERFSVYGRNGSILCAIERAGFGLFGVRAYGVHINGYICTDSQNPSLPTHLWIARRSKTKKTYPNLLDTLVGGGIPSGASVFETMVKEAQEEAGLDPWITKAQARPVGAVTFWKDDPRRGYLPDTEYLYDLKLSSAFQPVAVDGEVQEFLLWDIQQVKSSLKTNNAQEWTPEASLAVLEFLLRHGFISPSDDELGQGYAELITGLHRHLPFPGPL